MHTKINVAVALVTLEYPIIFRNIQNYKQTNTTFPEEELSLFKILLVVYFDTLKLSTFKIPEYLKTFVDISDISRQM